MKKGMIVIELSNDEILELRKKLYNNNIEKEAMTYVRTIPQGYVKAIDSLIAPLCALLISKGFFTLHSCSHHVRHIIRKSIKDGERVNRHTHRFGWYINFIVTQGTKQFDMLKSIVKNINQESQYPISLSYFIPIYNYDNLRKKSKEIPFVQVGSMKIDFEHLKHMNDDGLVELNKKIYVAFQKELENYSFSQSKEWEEVYMNQGFPNKYFS